MSIGFTSLDLIIMITLLVVILRIIMIIIKKKKKQQKPNFVNSQIRADSHAYRLLKAFATTCLHHRAMQRTCRML